MSVKIPKAKHEHGTFKFPKGFLWGTATSAFQVEGNNIHSDWWEWEQINQPPAKRTGMAANEYSLYEEDFDLAKNLSHNAHRLSLEWSRIEPVAGVFLQKEIDHYKKVLAALKKRGLLVMLTLHHFSNPAWLAQKGGWANIKASSYFERFVSKVVPELKDLVDFWITVNEPSGYAYLAFLSRRFPPQKNNWWLFANAYFQLVQAHKKAYSVIHQNIPHAKVGFANSVTSFDAFHNHSLKEKLVEFFADNITNHLFYKLTSKTHDFIGINYYQNQYISFNGESKLPALVELKTGQADVSDLGWEIFPEGIFDCLMDFSDYHLPIYITENGIASTNDDRRVRFLLSYLKEIYHAIELGVDVRGYFYWSLIDNMELNLGYNPRFGLIEVDFETQKRRIRPSAYVYKDIIDHNGIPHYLLKLLGHSLDVKKILKSLKLATSN